MLKWFMERLVERVVPLIATSFSSTVQTMHALTQAEQQSELEEAARRYESEGKPEIAQLLRLRAGELVSTDAAVRGVEIVQKVTGESQPVLPPPSKSAGGNLSQLPALDTPRRSRAKKKEKSDNASDPFAGGTDS